MIEARKDAIQALNQVAHELLTMPKEKENVLYTMMYTHGVHSSIILQALNHNAWKELSDIELYLLYNQMEWLLVKNEIPLIDFPQDIVANSAEYYRSFVKEGMYGQGKTFSLSNVIQVGNGAYVTVISVKQVAEMYEQGALNYNYNTQRQPKLRAGENKSGEIALAPTVYKKSVKEISRHLLEGTLVHTTLAYNLALGTGANHVESFYDSETKTLTINKDTRIDILDGYHRTLASVTAFRENPNIDFKFGLFLFNFDNKSAQQYQAQMAKANPIPVSRIKELASSRLADDVVTRLKIDSDLKGRIASQDKLATNSHQLVTYNVLSNAIDKYYPMKTRLDALKTAEYLKDYFMYVVGEFDDVGEMKDNLVLYNKMFLGHIILSKRLLENDIPLADVLTILNKIDFTKGSKDMEDYEITTKGKLSNKTVKGIEKLFIELPLSN